MGLKLTLKSGERLAVNGAILVNGGPRTSIIVENRAAILRGKDLVDAGDATTAARKVYHAVMSAYLHAAERAQHIEALSHLVPACLGEHHDEEARRCCARLTAHILDGEFYDAVLQAKTLLKIEAQVDGEPTAA